MTKRATGQLSLMSMWSKTDSGTTKRRVDDERNVGPVKRPKLQRDVAEVGTSSTTEEGSAGPEKQARQLAKEVDPDVSAAWSPATLPRATSSSFYDDFVEGAPLEGLDAGEYSEAKKELVKDCTAYWRYGLHGLEPPDGLIDNISRKFEACVALLEAKREEEKEKNGKPNAGKGKARQSP